MLNYQRVYKGLACEFWVLAVMSAMDRSSCGEVSTYSNAIFSQFMSVLSGQEMVHSSTHSNWPLDFPVTLPSFFRCNFEVSLLLRMRSWPWSGPARAWVAPKVQEHRLTTCGWLAGPNQFLEVCHNCQRYFNSISVFPPIITFDLLDADGFWLIRQSMIPVMNQPTIQIGSKSISTTSTICIRLQMTEPCAGNQWCQIVDAFGFRWDVLKRISKTMAGGLV